MTSTHFDTLLGPASYAVRSGPPSRQPVTGHGIALRDGVWPGGATGKGANGKPVGFRIRERLGDLTALEARVISALVSQHLIDDRTLLKVVASETKVSQAMVVKIAKKLGFDGFRSLRAALAEHNRFPLREIRQELSSYKTTADIVEKACRSSMNALGTTFSGSCFERLEGAAECIWRARQRDLYGVGSSAQVARDAAFKFLRIGIRTSVFDDGCMMSMSASLLRKGDVAVAFSFSGQNLTVLDAVRQARRNGAMVIAITNRSSSVLPLEANFAFSASADECPLTGETAAARVAQLGIVDALFMAVARINPAATETNLGSTISAIRAQRAPW
jgi:RpiR family transcriptional regulator, repressor of rpiB and als operon